MKKSLAITSLVAASAGVVAPGVQAEDNHKLGLKQFGASTLAIASGAAIGGPFGLLFGGVSAIFVSEQMEKAEAGKLAEQERTLAQEQVLQLRDQLHQNELHTQQVREMALDSLQMQVHFYSGKDELSPRNLDHLDRLTAVLLKNPRLQVRLLGHADARGTDGYNQILSEYRTRHVEEHLLKAGVAPERIESQAFGADRATAVKGDAEGYALDRRVAIEVYYPEKSNKGLARAH